MYKKEEDFKELLENLDIENIEIYTSQRISAIKKTRNEHSQNLPEEEDIMLEEKFSLEIEKLLSEEDDEETSNNSQSIIDQQLPMTKRKSSATNGVGHTRRLRIFEDITTD